MSRKKKLRNRADMFAARTEYVQDAAIPEVAASLAWEDGYRAAMRDARKAIAIPPCNCRDCHSDPKISDRARMFLRPLR